MKQLIDGECSDKRPMLLMLLTLYLASDVDESIPRYNSFLAEHLQVQQRTLTITVVELVLYVRSIVHVHRPKQQ